MVAKSKDVKTVGSKWAVYHGKAKHTVGGLKKNALCINKRGKVVSKKKQLLGKKAFKANGLKPKTKNQMANMRQKKNSSCS